MKNSKGQKRGIEDGEKYPLLKTWDKINWSLCDL